MEQLTRAFDLIRQGENRCFFLFTANSDHPNAIIQGTADVGKKLTEDELQRTMNFCRHLFAPADPEMHSAVKARQAFFICLSESFHAILNLIRLDPVLTSPSGPVMIESDIDHLFGEDDEETKIVLSEIKALKPFHTMYNLTDDFGVEEFFGFSAVLERGEWIW
ncbi:hypothetical protein AZE42_05835 [Rhizopogon vesiculosus]|uniref:Uncharacterized protein n=1 Tax=Rhizopogon vesiculosus TaxID=180088 RepID=A0A1J8PYH1_9AGAM|nr:hypothetical protein AZE42_05835 [Rhizopogon vesiculosus]